MNTVSVTGRAVRDIELKALPNSSKLVANGVIAVQRNFKNKEGSYDSDFLDFQAWDKKGELIAEYVDKGDFFGITGELRTRTYEKDGVKRKITEINVTDFDFPVKPKQSNQQENKPQDNTDPFANDGQPINLSDDDLPF